jgi:hypothetical protein
MATNQQLVDPGALLKVSSLAKKRRVSRTVIYKEIADKKLTSVIIDGTPHVIQKGSAL